MSMSSLFSATITISTKWHKQDMPASRGLAQSKKITLHCGLVMKPVVVSRLHSGLSVKWQTKPSLRVVTICHSLKTEHINLLTATLKSYWLFVCQFSQVRWGRLLQMVSVSSCWCLHAFKRIMALLWRTSGIWMNPALTLVRPRTGMLLE